MTDANFNACNSWLLRRGSSVRNPKNNKPHFLCTLPPPPITFTTTSLSTNTLKLDCLHLTKQFINALKIWYHAYQKAERSGGPRGFEPNFNCFLPIVFCHD